MQLGSFIRATSPTAARALLFVLLPAWVFFMCLGKPGAAQAHSFSAGAVEIDHPYATPTPPGVNTGAAYFRHLRNTGRAADKLVAASTSVATSVEIHRNTMDASNVMRMRAIDGLELPPGTTVPMRHGGSVHLMLIGLQAPLKAGDEFKLKLRFEKAGEREVVVTVQQPRAGSGGSGHEHHKH
jgi:periplasmic copper chaperone A